MHRHSVRLQRLELEKRHRLTGARFECDGEMVEWLRCQRPAEYDALVQQAHAELAAWHRERQNSRQ